VPLSFRLSPSIHLDPGNRRASFRIDIKERKGRSYQKDVEGMGKDVKKWKERKGVLKKGM
jgi:hypothetical protein